MKIFFIASIFLTVQLFPQQSWIQLTTPVKNNFVTLSVIDSLNAFAAGDSGTIIKTTNGGTSWQVLNFLSDKAINDIFFHSANHGWAITRNLLSAPFGSNIYYTNNGGESWLETSRFFEDIFLTTISFYDSLNGMSGSASGDLIKSSDGGINWDVVDDTVVTGLPIYSLKYFSPKLIFGSGGHIDFAGGIFTSTDYGAGWKLKLVGPEPIQHLHIFDSLNIVGVGGDYEFGTGVVRTTDGGNTWNYRSLDFFGIAVAVSFRTMSDGWATLGFGKNLMATSDSGKTWTLVATPNNISIYDLAFANDKVGYAVGDSGTVLKFQLNTVDVETENYFLPKGFELFQNYPNPFNPSTVISYQLSASGNVVLKIFDMLGNEVAVLIDNEWQESGRYNYQFSVGESIRNSPFSIVNSPQANQFPSGVYFYQLQCGDYIARKKMLLIK